MTQRLPHPGADNGDWGDILNDFLDVSHNPDGTLATNTVGQQQLQSNSVGTNQLQTGSVTNAQLDTPTQQAITQANNAAQLDGSGKLETSQLPGSVVTATGAVTAGNLPKFNGTGNEMQDSGLALSSVASAASSPTSSGQMLVTSESGSNALEYQCAPPGQGDLAALLSKVYPVAGDLAVTLLPNGTDFSLLYGWGNSRYWQSTLRYEATNPGGYGLNQLGYHAESVPMQSTPDSDSSCVFSGTWTSGTNAEAYNGAYKYATATASYVTITTPSCNRIGVRVPQLGNGGLARVEIDGSYTAANLLPTAQQLVTAGTYPDTILIANDGLCNPTDRVLDTYGATLYDVPIAIADENSLSVQAHTVVMTPVAVDRNVGGNDRFYISGYSYATTGTTTPQSANAVMHSVSNLNTNQGSAHEYAFEVGGTFFGNVHGYDQQNSISVTVDGVAQTLTAGEILQAQTSIEIIRTSVLLNPANTSQTLATATVVYHLDRNGLRVTPTIVWAEDITLQAAYGMFPMNGAIQDLVAQQADVCFTGGSLLNNPLGPFTFNGAGDVYYGKAKASAAWVYGTSEATAVGYCAVMWLPNVNQLVNGWANASPNYLSIEDRGSIAPHTSKIYFGRIWNGSGTTETVTVDETWTWDARYLLGRLPAEVAGVTA